MHKPDTLDGKNVKGEWWTHLKYMKRVIHKAERKNWKNNLQYAVRSYRGNTTV